MRCKRFVLVLCSTIALLALFSAKASADFSPSLGRWMEQDPINKIISRISTSGISGKQPTFTGNSAMNLGSFVDDGASNATIRSVFNARGRLFRTLGAMGEYSFGVTQYADGMSLYQFVQSNPIAETDAAGLCGNNSPNNCIYAPPMSSDAPNPYPPDYKYVGISGYWMFEDGGDNAWANSVRGCLACMYAQGVPTGTAHEQCYWAATKAHPWKSPWGLGRAILGAGWLGLNSLS